MTDIRDLQGSIVAIITPFDADGAVDYQALGRLVDFHLAHHTDGIVVCGTTGETPTLSDEEYAEVVRFVVQQVDHRIPVIAGAGSNSTAKTVANCHAAEAAGVDALLVVGPYYNKPTPQGFYLHFKAISDAVHLPIIVYNVPGRTGKNIPVSILLKLAHECPGIMGVKEASGDIGQIMQILRDRTPGFRVYSGDDALALAVVALGGDGCISVVANEIPSEFSEIVHAALSGEWDRARELHFRFLELMNLNFIESNPIPVKTAVSLMGLSGPQFRLPMCAMEPAAENKLRAELVALGLVQEQ